MKTRHINKYVIDLKILEDIIDSIDYYEFGNCPYDSINIGVDIYFDNNKVDYLLVFSISTELAKAIKSFSRSLTMEDIFITFVDSNKANKYYNDILNDNIRNFPFKSIYERASNIIGSPTREYVCDKHVVFMTDITGDFDNPRILITIDKIAPTEIMKIKFCNLFNKNRRYYKTPKSKIIDSFYDIDL